MFLYLGAPDRLSDIPLKIPEMPELKRRFDIAVIDDEPFVRLDALRTHGFRLTELGGDIKSLEQIAVYPIVICDIRGVGKAFGSRHEGAHVVQEIRKAYPDKFLVAYTGVVYDPSYNEKLASADGVLAKDAPIEQWTQVLERGLSSIGDPKQRWIRFRSQLLDRGMELFVVLKLEQAFIKALIKRDSSVLANEARHLPFSDELKDLVVKFSGVAVAQLIEHLLMK